MPQNEFRSGFVAIVGRPNVGKSTLMNAMIGEKISIISPKPQTTRNKIQSICTKERFQAIFLDTPGMHQPRTKLGEYMMKSVDTSLLDVDLVLLLVEPTPKLREADREIVSRLQKVKCPVYLIINKMDKVEKSALLAVMEAYKNLMEFAEIIPISALQHTGVDELLLLIEAALPLGPKYFPEDMITDQPERQIAAEMIREKALQLLEDEIPHGIAVEIVTMKKRDGKDMVDVDATIYCEKESHKGIVIGKNGAVLKEIGKRARADIQRLLGSPIYLQLWVKVKKDWRDNDFLLKNFGYDKKKV